MGCHRASPLSSQCACGRGPARPARNHLPFSGSPNRREKVGPALGSQRQNSPGFRWILLLTSDLSRSSPSICCVCLKSVLYSRRLLLSPGELPALVSLHCCVFHARNVIRYPSYRSPLYNLASRKRSCYNCGCDLKPKKAIKSAWATCGAWPTGT